MNVDLFTSFVLGHLQHVFSRVEALLGNRLSNLVYTWTDYLMKTGCKTESERCDIVQKHQDAALNPALIYQ